MISYSSKIGTLDDLREALADRYEWRVFVDDLEANDFFYSPQVFKADIFDDSVIGRLIRRAWGQKIFRDRNTALRSSDGFSNSSGIPEVFRAILVDFARRCYATGKRPVVILIEDQGYGGLLSELAVRTLEDSNIEYVLSSEIASPNDKSLFLPDGHFTPAANERIAKSVIKLLGRGL